MVMPLSLFVLEIRVGLKGLKTIMPLLAYSIVVFKLILVALLRGPSHFITHFVFFLLVLYFSRSNFLFFIAYC
jgi:hypothetical protein